MRALAWSIPVLSLAACGLSTTGLGTQGGAGGSATTAPAGSSSSSSSSGSTSSSTATGGAGGTSQSSSSTDVGGNATCADQLRNGGETDVDCGGDACPPCGEGLACAADTDCISGACRIGVCRPSGPACQPLGDQPTCGDCTKNGGETDVDCGGDACPPCGDGLGCTNDADCASGSCQAGECAVAGSTCEPVGPDPTCGDCTTNGTETDVDCGGDLCNPCPAGKTCLVAADCLSGACTGGICATGPGGSPCRGAADCAGAACQPGLCWTGMCCE